MMRASSDDYTDGDVYSYELDPLSNGSSPAGPSDHVTAFGGTLLIFEAFKSKLDDMNRKGGRWSGFSPRWTIPMKILNPKKPELITSIMLIIMDTGREAGFAIGPHFSKTVLGDSELLVSESAMKFLEVQQTRQGVFVLLLYDLPPVAEYWRGLTDEVKQEMIVYMVDRMGFDQVNHWENQKTVQIESRFLSLDFVH